MQVTVKPLFSSNFTSQLVDSIHFGKCVKMVEVIIHYINSNEQRNETLTAIDNTQNPDRQKFLKKPSTKF